MKLFIPAVGYRIKLTQPWTFALYGESRNQTMFEESGLKYEDHVGHWRDKLRSADVTVAADTILEVDRVYVRNASKDKSGDDDYDSVTFRVIDDKKKKRRFWAKLVDVNNIEYELPPDHTAGKDAAKERATKQKKLNPQKIKDTLFNAIHLYTAKNGPRQAPVWLSKDVVAGFKLLETEYVRLFEPYERAKHDKQHADRRTQLERDFATGKLSIPVGLADKVKCVDDLKKFGMYDSWLDKGFEFRCSSWDYIVPYKLLGSYGYQGTKVFERLPDGTCCRTFRPASPDKGNTWSKDEPSISHMWIKVYTDNGDFNVIKVESGIDAQ